MHVPGAPYELTKTYDLYLINLTPDVHPMHIHLINFQYYKTAKLDVERYQAAWFELNGGEPPYDKNPKHL
jgi:FtsP/CotA-like multicopper oxidase with cupredoxin domain